MLRGATYAWNLIREGKTRFLLAEIWVRIYKQLHEWLFHLRYRIFGKLPPPGDFQIRLETRNPIAFESPDHLNPWGTMRDNSTHKKFVTFMAARLRAEHPSATYGSLDLGCSGGQLVRDFRDLGWLAVGLEGSDFSLKHKRANWPELAGKNLFTCDITKPFQVFSKGEPARFHLVTSWEVLEHIHPNDHEMLFTNIVKHLVPGGYFIASTTSAPDVHNGVDLHQTKWTNREWKTNLAKTFPMLEPVDLGLKSYQFVRHNEEGSFLVYRRNPSA